MNRIRVVADSACDLPDELLGELGITLVPLHIRFGHEELVDRAELSTKEFWARAARTDQLPETAAPSPGAFREAFEAAQADGAEGVVCIDLSSKMSATIQAARQAARDLEGTFPVQVVDSLSVTMGLGLIVMAAAEAAAGGAGLEEVAGAASRAAASVKVYGAIDTLDNLKRGGRIGGASALVGSLLAIKPVIQVREGVVEQESRQRTRGKSLRYLADKVKAAQPVARLAAFGADAADFDQFLGMLAGVGTDHPLLVGDIGPVIGTHAGPGAVGVAWLPA